MPFDKKVSEIRPGVMDQHGRKSGGEPPSDGEGMETRLTRLETKVETVLPTLATKGDVSEAKAAIIMWLAGTVFAAVAIIISVFAFMLNRAIPIQPVVQPAPVVVYPPVQQVPQSPPTTKRSQ